MKVNSTTKKKLVSLASALLVLIIFYVFNPSARDLSTFTANLKRNRLIDNCVQNATSTSHVIEVIDGDTIEVLTPTCGVERVRMIGINTPETVDPNRPVQCFGHEASDRAKAILSDKDVTIKGDPSQDERDKYGRLLAYVFLPDGSFFNEEMIRDGYAYEYTYLLPYQYQKEFRQAEAEAKTEQKGLWSPATCDGRK